MTTTPSPATRRPSLRRRALLLPGLLAGVLLAGAGVAAAAPTSDTTPGTTRDRAIWLTTVDGEDAGTTPLFADHVLVPGDVATDALLLHHRGDLDDVVELRMTPRSAPNPLEEQAELTLSTPQSTATLTLAEALRDGVVLELPLPQDSPVPLDLEVALPAESGNETRDLAVALQISVTAVGDDVVGEPDPGSDADADDGLDDGRDPDDDSDSDDGTDDGSDDASGADPIDADDGPLPDTGASGLLPAALTLAAVLLGGGLALLRRRPVTPGAG